ncbi:hypothetical protein V8E51_007751 [Hyaloscypha variabilis]
MSDDMSSATTSTRGALHKRLRYLIVQACEVDDVDLISQALTLGSVEQVTKLAFPRVFSQNAPKVLEYLLTHGSDVKAIADIAATHIALAAYERTFPKSLVQILLNHGWDINHRHHDQPLLWQIVYDGDAVAWCLERGASILPKGQKLWPEFNINNAEAFAEYFERFPYSSKERSDCLYYCPPILELAAQQSTVTTFELLRSKGAPLGWRVLHMAATGRACSAVPEHSVTKPANPIDEVERQFSDRELARTPEERMNMVRHLVDNLKLDVNARDQPPGWILGNFFGRPLHYVAQKSGSKGDCREVTLFLLQKGADPELEDGGGMIPMALGKGSFLDAVKEWKLMQTSDAVQSSAGEN